MALTFPTTDLKKPSGLTAIPSGFKRPGFGTLYGFDAQGGAPAFSNSTSVSLDGTDDYIDVGNDSSLAPANLTLSCWFKASGTANTYNYLISRNGATYGSYYLRYKGSGGAVGSNKFNYFMSVGTYFVQGDFNTSVDLTDWHHVALTYDGSYIKGYVDGNEDYSLAETRAINYTADSTYGTDTWIGKGKYPDPAEGLIDEVAIFNTALSASDITAIYNSGAPADLTSYSPVSWWRMGDNDGGTGTTITDQGSGGNNGTLTNGPTFSTTVPT